MPAPAPPISVVTLILNVTATISVPLHWERSTWHSVCPDIRVCVCLGCSGTEVILATECTQSPSLLCGQALISSVHLSGFRGIPTGLHSNTLPRSTSGLPQHEDNPPSSCWTFLFQIGLQWKGGLLIPRKHNRRHRLCLPLSAPLHTHREILGDCQSSQK